MKNEDTRVNEFRLLIKPLSLGMQLGGMVLVAMVWILADESYQYDHRWIILLAALTVTSVFASWKIAFFSFFSIFLFYNRFFYFFIFKSSILGQGKRNLIC